VPAATAGFQVTERPSRGQPDEPKPRFTVHAHTIDELQAKVRAAFTRMMEREKHPVKRLEITHRHYEEPPTSAMYIEAVA
jgi:hypothetical protein